MIYLIQLALLGAPAWSQGLRLKDFSFERSRTFAQHLRREDAPECQALLTAASPATGRHIERVEDLRRGADDLIAGWAAAPLGHAYYADYKADFESTFDRLTSLRASVDFPAGMRASIDRAINALGFITTYRGYVSPPNEWDARLIGLLLRVRRLRSASRPGEGQVARLVFDLTVLSGQYDLRRFRNAARGDAAMADGEDGRGRLLRDLHANAMLLLEGLAARP